MIVVKSKIAGFPRDGRLKDEVSLYSRDSHIKNRAGEGEEGTSLVNSAIGQSRKPHKSHGEGEQGSESQKVRKLSDNGGPSNLKHSQ